jgi:hypothetical protein
MGRADRVSGTDTRDEMSGGMAFACSLAVGAALIAAWVDARLGDRRPTSLAIRIAHAGAAFSLLRVATVAVQHLASPEAPYAQRLGTLFLLLLPGLVYAFIASLWLVRTFVEIARLARH